MSNSVIPDTTAEKIAMIAAALEMSKVGMPHDDRSSLSTEEARKLFDLRLSLYADAYKAISKLVQGTYD